MNLLNEAIDPSFVKRKFNIVNGQSKGSYAAGNKIVYNTEVLKSNLRYYNDAFILVRGDFTIIGDNGSQVTFKNCAQLIKLIATLMGQQ